MISKYLFLLKTAAKFATDGHKSDLANIITVASSNMARGLSFKMHWAMDMFSLFLPVGKSLASFAYYSIINWAEV